MRLTTMLGVSSLWIQLVLFCLCYQPVHTLHVRAAQLAGLSSKERQSPPGFAGSPGTQAPDFAGSPGTTQAPVFAGSPGTQAPVFAGSPGTQAPDFAGSPKFGTGSATGAPVSPSSESGHDPQLSKCRKSCEDLCDTDPSEEKTLMCELACLSQPQCGNWHYMDAMWKQGVSNDNHQDPSMCVISKCLTTMDHNHVEVNPS